MKIRKKLWSMLCNLIGGMVVILWLIFCAAIGEQGGWYRILGLAMALPILVAAAWPRENP